ncbi:MAG: hypothetical protein NT091_02330 [Candidatus Falkowbacteria bacterium]|nr:hypothetical protein [Candidatus Falkowbacteria bacterium]
MSNKEYNWPEKTRKALVSNRNIIFYHRYIESYNKENNTFFSLFNDKNEEKFYLNKDEWCTLEDYIRIVERARRLISNFELPRIAGLLFSRHIDECGLGAFQEEIFRNLKAFFLGPVEIFRQISFFNYLFNKTKTMDFISGKNGQCIIKIKFNKEVDPVFDYVSEMHINGMIESVIDIFNLKNAKINTPLKEYDLKKLIEIKFAGLNEECRISGNLFFLGESLLAQKVILQSELVHHKAVFLGKDRICSRTVDCPCERGIKEEGCQHGWRIVRDVYLYDKYLILKKGDVYNAPYFISIIEWNKINPLRAMLELIKASRRDISPFGSKYLKLIDRRLKKERKEASIRHQRQKLETEFHQLLLKTYVHPRFISKAKIGLIPVRDVHVTNIFLDLANSTQIRQDLGDNAYRRDKNIFLNLVRKKIFEADGEWGWLNKVMGDGCYILFGTYNYFKQESGEQDNYHTEAALNFASSLVKEINQIKLLNEHKKPEDQLFARFNLRFGIEVGDVEIGEAYEHDLDKDTQKIGMGTLRVFDADGQSIHVAKRIEEASKLILKEEGLGRTGGIFLGPAIMDIVAKDQKFKIKPISLEKLGIKVRDFHYIETVGELDPEIEQ